MEYRKQKIHCIVIFKILREFFFSKLVEDNDTFYYEIMSCSNVLSLELVKYICKKIRIHPVFIFKVKDKYYKSSDDNPLFLTEYTILYNEDNNIVQIISDELEPEPIVVNDNLLKGYYDTHRAYKIRHFYGNNTRLHKIIYWDDP